MSRDIENEDRRIFEEFYNKLRYPDDVKTVKIIRSRKIRNKKCKKILKAFMDFFKEHFPEYSKRLNDNIGTLVIKKKLINFSRRGGQYNVENTIILYEYEALIHELFHMSASLLTEQGEESVHSGFRDKYVGDGLNEGYTQLLSERYFDTAKTYKRLVPIARRIEMIVGQEKMEEYYFTGGLKKLVDELQMYIKPCESISIIETLINKMNELKSAYSGFDEIVLNIYKCILKLYSGKLYFKVKYNEISSDEACEAFKNFKDDILENDFRDEIIEKKGLFNHIKRETFMRISKKEEFTKSFETLYGIEEYQLKDKIKELYRKNPVEELMEYTFGKRKSS